ncbi:unnamed protein product [Acidithrix sp. C25]|nr:unnamed protein product [Acidithrix sp. C25]
MLAILKHLPIFLEHLLKRTIELPEKLTNPRYGRKLTPQWIEIVGAVQVDC